MSDLQELYRHLEHAIQGDRHMAYYGQLRAEGETHKEALTNTIVYFRLRTRDWYKARGLVK